MEYDREEKKGMKSMNELSAARMETGMEDAARLAQIGARCRVFAQAARENIYELGRELTDAKAICPRGEWARWVEENAEVSVREAQLYMAAWERFGKNDRVRALPKSAAFRLLPLPEEALETFLHENPVEDMTTREIERKVKEAREQGYEEAAKQAANELAEMSKARKAAEARARELARQNGTEETAAEELKKKNEEIRKYKAEVDRLAVESRKLMEETNRARKEKAIAEKAQREQEEMLGELQEAYDRTREEMRSMESAQARGEAERKSREGEMTGEAFLRAARELVTTCARAPFMEREFSKMDGEERATFETGLNMVEKWAASVRSAMRVWDAEGVIV